MAEQATFQEPAKFPYYEGRHAAVSCRSLCQKSLEVLLDDFVEQRILGRAAPVFDGSDLRGTARATNCQLSTRANGMPGAGETGAPQTHEVGHLDSAGAGHPHRVVKSRAQQHCHRRIAAWSFA